MQKSSNSKILLLLKIPPPLTGATLMNQYILEIKTLHFKYVTRAITVHYSKFYYEQGRASLRKMFIFLYTWLKFLHHIIFFNPRIIYFQISPLGFAFYRDLLFTLIIKIFRKQVIYHLHGKGIKTISKRYPIIKKIYQFVFRKSEVICLSKLISDDIEDVFIGKPFIVNNGLAITCKTLPKRPVNNVPVLLYIANLKKSKGLLDLLNLLEILKKNHTAFIAKIIGNESFEINKSKLQYEIEKRDLRNKIEYLGPIYGNDKIPILLNADIFVYPTLNDAMPLVLIEAMQYGLPIIAYDEGAIPVLVQDGDNGFIVEKGNYVEFAERLIFLLNNPNQVLIMGNKGRSRFLNKFTLENFQTNILNVFQTILNKINHAESDIMKY